MGILLTLGTTAYATIGAGLFNLDPQNRPGAFEPFLAKYVRASEYVIGLATGSIVLLVGSSALHAQSGRLPLVLCLASLTSRFLCHLRRRIHGLVDIQLRGTSARQPAHSLCLRTQPLTRFQLARLLLCRIRVADHSSGRIEQAPVLGPRSLGEGIGRGQPTLSAARVSPTASVPAKCIEKARHSRTCEPSQRRFVVPRASYRHATQGVQTGGPASVRRFAWPWSPYTPRPTKIGDAVFHPAANL